MHILSAEEAKKFVEEIPLEKREVAWEIGVSPTLLSVVINGRGISDKVLLKLTAYKYQRALYEANLEILELKKKPK